MSTLVSTLCLLAVATLFVFQFASLLGRWRGAALGLALAAILGAAWWLLGHAAPPEAGPADWSTVASVGSEACAKCHAGHYESWRRTFHRTMTRDATPEYVKGDFNNAVYDYQGLT